MKPQKQSRWKRAVATGLVAIAEAVQVFTGGCAETLKFDKKPDVYAETTFATKAVYGSGSVIGRNEPMKHNGVNESLVNVDFKNGLSALVWSNYNFLDEELHDLDVGAFYNFPITEKVSGKVGLWRWNYPSELLGKYDNLAVAGISYHDKIDASLNYLHLIGHDNVESGDFFTAGVSKTFPLGKIGETGISLTPSLRGALGCNYYGSSGLYHTTPGVSIEFKKGRRSFNAFVNHQLGTHGKHDLTYGGVSFGYKF